jgi:protein TonB
MFERLVESDSTAQFKPRRSYFMVSTVVVGILFLTAVVISLYAEEVDLGAGDLEIAALIAPVTAEAPEPPKAEPAPAASQSSDSSKLPVRNDAIARVDEVPKVTPTGVSSVPSEYMSRPPGEYRIDPYAQESNGYGPPSGASGTSGTCTLNCGSSVSDSGHIAAARPEATFEEPPPPVKKKESPKAPVTLGVVNGRAVDLPKPPYPAPARAVGAQGNVNVQVLIDEQGNVVSAKVIEGHHLLRAAAVDAAKKARFSPTTLSDVPVKVTGIIVYKFTRN